MSIEKRDIHFSDRAIFGKPLTANKAQASLAVVARMLINNKIQLNGTIFTDNPDEFQKEELWAYIYYLYLNNQDNIVFSEFHDVIKGKITPIGEKFYTGVRTYLEGTIGKINESENAPLKNDKLIIFINNIIEENQNRLNNPLFDYLRILLESKREELSKFSGFTIKTGDNQGEFKITTNPENAHIKFNVSRI